MEKTIEALQDQNMNSHIIIGYAFSKVTASDNPQPIKLENATLVFNGGIYPKTQRARALSTEKIAKKLQQNCEENLEELVKRVEGDFAFAVAEPKRIIAGRELMGVRPLYYGENTNSSALASTRKALWKIRIDNPRSFPPGHLASIDNSGFKFKHVKILESPKPKRITMQTAAKELQNLLEYSVQQRVLGLKEVAVAFSGGLDSSIIAFLAKKSKANVHLVHVSLECQEETETARLVAEELELPMHVCMFKEESLEGIVPRIIELIEEPDPIKTSIGIPMYWAAEKTAEMELKVLLAGQGADELFGGYKRYVDNYLACGPTETVRIIFDDIAGLHKANFERDFKLCNFHGVELRLPFASYKIAEFAKDLPLELKIERKQDSMRKLVLRQTAENLGLSQLVTRRPKRAIQYATGVDKALKRLAKKQETSVKEYLRKIFQRVKIEAMQDCQKNKGSRHSREAFEEYEDS
jgi:asparagine synthase (glutamine-hydrolysing)